MCSKMLQPTVKAHRSPQSDSKRSGVNLLLFAELVKGGIVWLGGS
jgi:hypothetical protein